MGIPVTPLLGRVFGTLDAGLRYGQAKISFPYGTTAASISANYRRLIGDSQDDRPVPPIDFGIPTVPVELDLPVFYPGSEIGVYPVFPGSVGGGGFEILRETRRVGEVSTEVEVHPEGDFPAGSIFAPGRTWGREVGSGDFDEGTPEEDEMAHDWGHLFREVAGSFFSPEPEAASMFAGPAAALGSATAIPGGSAASLPSAAPVMSNGAAECGNRRYVTLDRQTGKITCKRRRRRRLLTNRDLADLASLKTITGGGAALNAAVIRAVR